MVINWLMFIYIELLDHPTFFRKFYCHPYFDDSNLLSMAANGSWKIQKALTKKFHDEFFRKDILENKLNIIIFTHKNLVTKELKLTFLKACKYIN